MDGRAVQFRVKSESLAHAATAHTSHASHHASRPMSAPMSALPAADAHVASHVADGSERPAGTGTNVLRGKCARSLFFGETLRLRFCCGLCVCVNVVFFLSVLRPTLLPLTPRMRRRPTPTTTRTLRSTSTSSPRSVTISDADLFQSETREETHLLQLTMCQRVFVGICWDRLLLLLLVHIVVFYS